MNYDSDGCSQRMQTTERVLQGCRIKDLSQFRTTCTSNSRVCIVQQIDVQECSQALAVDGLQPMLYSASLLWGLPWALQPIDRCLQLLHQALCM